MEGEIKNWITSRGFGFVRPDVPGPDVFIHCRAFKPLVDTVRIGTRVSYELGHGPNGLRAINARILDDAH